jgi:hypothetical protein
MTLLPAPSPGQRGLHRSVGQFRLAGHVAGYIETQFGVDSGTTSLIVVDVSTRHTIRMLPAGTYVDAGIIFREGVTDFLVTPHGSIAWIIARSEHRAAPLLTVHVAARSGPARTLDEGGDIGESSLALAGGTVSWWHAGSERTAPMP